MDRPPPPIPLLSSVAPLASESEAWVVDIWGVMHNGVRAFAAAAEACRMFRGRGGVVVLLSNAPRPAEAVQAQLDQLGVPRGAYDGLVTSGDLTRLVIREHTGDPVFHLGPERDAPLFAGLDIAFSDADSARLVVCTGLFDDERETPDDYRPMLARLAERRIPMACANPDLTVERGERVVPCAGALARLYERLGGPVLYSGKPHRPVYELVARRMSEIRGSPVPDKRILAIGDGIHTDIRGAATMGWRAVFVASAIHVPGQLDAATLAALFADNASRPVAAMAALRW
jgi:HAD superfamily hydrolase (TIGR01459 family)